jgi:phosphoribosylformylglycinamidine cyclo-ligase
MDYKQAGVDIEAGNEVVRRIRSLARGTFTPGVLSEIGSFGGLFRLDAAGISDPVLVASADGVGTKLRLAFLTGVHRTIGTDLVNHCVNDILVQGAQPLFFLDYLATGRLEPDVAVQVVEGLSRACVANGCALLGGETAEMPGFYADGEYDLAGFIVGAVARDRLIDGRTIAPGDALVGVPSSGLHTNGYSLARRIVFELAGLRADSHVAELDTTVGAALLEPHRSYLPLVRPLLPSRLIKGMAHITGGGITDNLPRILPADTAAVIDRSAWDVPPLFRWLQRTGNVPDEDMFRTFNMGIGLIVACANQAADRIVAALADAGEPNARRIGRVVQGKSGVQYVAT